MKDKDFARVHPLFGQQTSDKMNVDDFIISPSFDLPEFISILGMEKKGQDIYSLFCDLQPLLKAWSHCQSMLQ